MSKKDFGQWMSDLAQQAADPATKDTLEGIQKKLQAERQAKMERKLLAVYQNMEQYAKAIRDLRRQEASYKKYLKDLAEKAEKIVQGKDED